MTTGVSNALASLDCCGSWRSRSIAPPAKMDPIDYWSTWIGREPRSLELHERLGTGQIKLRNSEARSVLLSPTSCRAKAHVTVKAANLTSPAFLKPTCFVLENEGISNSRRRTHKHAHTQGDTNTQTNAHKGYPQTPNPFRPQFSVRFPRRRPTHPTARSAKAPSMSIFSFALGAWKGQVRADGKTRSESKGPPVERLEYG